MCPGVVYLYNTYIGGVDVSDQRAVAYARRCTAVPFVVSESALSLVLKGFTPCRTTSWMMQLVMASAGLKRVGDDPFKEESGTHCKIDSLLFLNSEICTSLILTC